MHLYPAAAAAAFAAGLRTKKQRPADAGRIIYLFVSGVCRHGDRRRRNTDGGKHADAAGSNLTRDDRAGYDRSANDRSANDRSGNDRAACNARTGDDRTRDDRTRDDASTCNDRTCNDRAARNDAAGPGLYRNRPLRHDPAE